MANSRVLFVMSVKNLLNNYGLIRCNFATFKREYSFFPKHYIQPIFKKDEQEALFQSEKGKVIVHESIKPALTTDTSSEFHDPKVLKFTNILMRNGNKKLANKLVAITLREVKKIQLQRYHKATNEEKEEIELDPFVIFHSALANCTPILHLQSCKKGGITYQVPVPITPSKAQHTAMKWLIEIANEKTDDERFYDKLAKDLIAASQNQVYKLGHFEGGAVRRKQELHKKCQENRVYAHFRWL